MERENKFALKYKMLRAHSLPSVAADLPLDTEFAQDGYLKLEIDSFPAARAATVVSYPWGGEERYVVGYYNGVRQGSPRAGFTQFKEDGSVDRAFGIRGHVLLQLEVNRSTIPVTSFIDAQDNLVVYANSIEDVPGNPILRYNHSYLIKMNHIGVLDESFGDKGQLNLDALVNSHFPPRYEEYNYAYCFSAFPDPNGGYYLSAHIMESLASKVDSLIVRLNANGTIDTNFGESGGIIIRRNETAPSNVYLTDLAVHEGKLLASCVIVGDETYSVLYAYTLEGQRDFGYGKGGEARPGIISEAIGSLSDNTLSAVGFTYHDNKQFAALSTVHESGTIIKRYEEVGAGLQWPYWLSASKAGNRIYCLGGDFSSPSMVGCYSADTLELDKSFNEVGYGMLVEAVVGDDHVSIVLPNGSLLIAGVYQGRAAVFAVKTTS